MLFPIEARAESFRIVTIHGLVPLTEGRDLATGAFDPLMTLFNAEGIYVGRETSSLIDRRKAALGFVLWLQKLKKAAHLATASVYPKMPCNGL